MQTATTENPQHYCSITPSDTLNRVGFPEEEDLLPLRQQGRKDISSPCNFNVFDLELVQYVNLKKE